MIRLYLCSVSPHHLLSQRLQDTYLEIRNGKKKSIVPQNTTSQLISPRSQILKTTKKLRSLLSRIAVIQKHQQPDLTGLDVWQILITGQEPFPHLDHISTEFSPCFKPWHFSHSQMQTQQTETIIEPQADFCKLKTSRKPATQCNSFAITESKQLLRGKTMKKVQNRLKVFSYAYLQECQLGMAEQPHFHMQMTSFKCENFNCVLNYSLALELLYIQFITAQIKVSFQKLFPQR